MDLICRRKCVTQLCSFGQGAAFSDRIRGLPAHRHVISATIYAIEKVILEARNIPGWQLIVSVVNSSQLAQEKLHFVKFQCDRFVAGHVLVGTQTPEAHVPVETGLLSYTLSRRQR